MLITELVETLMVALAKKGDMQVFLIIDSVEDQIIANSLEVVASVDENLMLGAEETKEYFIDYCIKSSSDSTALA